MNDLLIVKVRLELARKRFEELWNERMKTDKDVLEAGEEVDKWVNAYIRIKEKQNLKLAV